MTTPADNDFHFESMKSSVLMELQNSSPFPSKLNSHSSRRASSQSSSSRPSIIFLNFSVNISHQLDNLPEDADTECLIVIPMEFISESGDHIFM